MSKSFDEKLKSMLEANDFKLYGAWSADYGRYGNAYCSVFFANLARQQNQHRWRWYLDYYEER